VEKEGSDALYGRSGTLDGAGNAIDSGEGPEPFFAYIAAHFCVQAMYGDPSVAERLTKVSA
jgi:hypothetical protein